MRRGRCAGPLRRTMAMARTCRPARAPRRSGGRAGSSGPPASGRSVLLPLEVESGSSAGTEGTLGRRLPLPSGARMHRTLPRSAGLPRSFAPTGGVRWSATVLGAPKAKRSRAKLSMRQKRNCGDIAAKWLSGNVLHDEQLRRARCERTGRNERADETQMPGTKRNFRRNRRASVPIPLWICAEEPIRKVRAIGRK